MSEVLLRQLGCPPFRQRIPWWGADLQTLRDTLRGTPQLPAQPEALTMPIGASAALLALLDRPSSEPAQALVLLTHGLGGSSEAPGPRRLAQTLTREGFAVLRLNLRGAGAGRALAPGTYAADCSDDLLPVLEQARLLAGVLAGKGEPLPLVGAGISLGGTVLLNAMGQALKRRRPALDGLVCISSPLDLQACAHQFERPRNRLYQHWLVQRLCRQTLADPHGLSQSERLALTGAGRPRSIRHFDALITAPRWGYTSVDQYYTDASPQRWLQADLPLPPTLLLHAADDPWVPADTTLALARLQADDAAALPKNLELCITPRGGHNGFHGQGDSPQGCWSDRVAARWLLARLPRG